MPWLGALGALLAVIPSSGATVVVLPFANNSGVSNLDWIGESIGESTSETLAAWGASGALFVIDRDERVETYQRLSVRELAQLTRATVLKIGETLDADLVLHGEFSVNAGTLKITARLVDLRRLRQGPEFQELGALSDLATLESHLAWQALQFLLPKSAPSETEFRKQQLSVRLDAEENYVRGLLADTRDERRRRFAEAVRLDPRFSHAWYALGRWHYENKEFALAADAFSKVSPPDVHFREANYLLGICRFQASDYAGAQKAFQMVADVVPLSEVLNNLAAAQSRLNLPQALDNFKKALDGDPGDPVYHFNTGFALFKRGDFTGAAERFRAVLDRDPQDQMAILMLGRALKRNRALDPKSQNLERIKTNYEERAWWQLKSVMESKLEARQ
jgi:tetratricopeptide (TPR) repeat protein